MRTGGARSRRPRCHCRVLRVMETYEGPKLREGKTKSGKHWEVKYEHGPESGSLDLGPGITSPSPCGSP